MELGDFFQVPVNYFAVLLCGISSMIIGFFWYGPLFGKEWMKLIGLTTEKQEKAKKSMRQNYTAMFIASLVMAWILFHFIWYAAPGSYTLFISIKIAIYAWIGFIVTVSYTKFLSSPDRKPIKLLFIETGYQLASLIAMGAIFYLFK
ncbi:DUF1761 domain-containing protein [Patescibacteria group bacterium]|nr:DUF1761 domain-containing protein [Patescibacteria group bacterium]MBU4016467.1 DUF1761 domain-containing protein [Patescibacteria group bacterium]